MQKRRVDFEEDPYPYFVVHLPPDFDTRKLMKMKTILDFKVRWEKLNTQNRATQCHRCQQYGHGAEYCSYAPRCVKCIGSHLSSECPTNELDEPEIQCTNCKGKHVASYRKCPAFREYKDRIEKEREQRASRNTRVNNKRLPPEPRPITRPAAYAAGRSYAQAASQPATPQVGRHPAPHTQQPQHRPPPTAYNYTANHTTNHTSDFQQLTNELKKLNSICDIRSLLAMVQELNSRMTKEMDNLTKLDIMLDVTSRYSNE